MLSQAWTALIAAVPLHAKLKGLLTGQSAFTAERIISLEETLELALKPVAYFSASTGKRNSLGGGDYGDIGVFHTALSFICPGLYSYDLAHPEIDSEKVLSC